MNHPLTAEELIAANPRYGFVPATIGGVNGLKGKDPETGEEHWCIYAGNSHVDAPGPWDDEQIKAAVYNLSAAAPAVDRRSLVPRPTRAARA